MRRSALLGMTVVSTVLLLGGCSGLGKFFGDTISLPGMNPNLPYGLNENAARAEGHHPEESPILPEPGNVWPGPPQPLPTLSDVSRTQGNGLDSGTQLGGPSLHDGGSMSMGENDQITHGAPLGADSFSGGGVLSGQVPDAAQHYRMRSGGDKNQSIVIPNGDGTSTVIGPDGSVKTIKSAPTASAPAEDAPK